ncbi:MAG: putative RNA methyltransferase, partial [Bdellovibrionota bacterium]
QNGYQLESEEKISFSVALKNAEQIQDLLAMTPHAFRIAQEGREALAKLQHLTVTAEVVFRVLALK